jgi:uncharacterized RDD family membrane protein YckC
VIAYLIDIALNWAVVLACALVIFVNDTAGGVLMLLGYVGFFIWNHIVRQGSTGQSVGKANQNIALISEETGQPAGVGLALARAVIGLFGFVFTCFTGLYGLLDVLWPLWDEKNQRLTDKLIKLNVVTQDS